MACGESLFRIGHGERHLSYQAPLPGSILIVAPNQAAQPLADALAASGHSVRLVGSVSELGAELANRQFDIVLALFSERQLVEAEMIASTARFLPIASVDERRAAREMYTKAVTSNDSLKRYLRTIHWMLKEARA
ncbi:MAG: hypothetical protein OES38_02465 [Gammaproteobacteria bacterium]|nr:hypothetical protein [Gammaproteobacteria bacterium]